MLKYLRIGVSTLALSAFVIAPVITVVTADYAYAKNGNGNGGGNGNGNGGGKGNGNGGGDKGADRGADKGGKGKGHDKAGKTRSASNGNKAKGNKSKGNKSFGRAVKDDFNTLSRNVKKHGIAGLFKGDKQQRKTRSVSAKPTKNAPLASTRPAKRVGYKIKDDMHPSNLGKMNGLLNSSPNAKLAHIANGQYLKGTGPVSLAAALAVADYEALHIQEDYATAYGVEVDDALMDAIDTIHLSDAYDVLDVNDALPEEEQLNRETAQSILDEADPASDEYQQAESYLDALDKVEEAEADLAEGEEDARPDEDRLADANDVIDAQEGVEEAEAGVLSTYKGDLELADEDALLDAARDSLPDDEAVGAALGKTPEDDDATIQPVDDDMADEETDSDVTTDSAMAEEINTAEQG